MPLFITEYAAAAVDRFNYSIASGKEPAIADYSITSTSSSQQSPFFSEQTAFVMLHAQEATCIAWGKNPTAVTTKQRMAAGETRYVGVPAAQGFRLACILGV